MNGLYEEMDSKNDKLEEKSKELEYFRKYLSKEMYNKIVERGEREHEIRIK